MKSKNLAIASMLLAASMIIGVVENLIPPIIPFLPYVKLGLSNVVIIIAILLLNYKYAFAIIALKSILVPLLVANPVMILYSLPIFIVRRLNTALLIQGDYPYLLSAYYLPYFIISYSYVWRQL